VWGFLHHFIIKILRPSATSFQWRRTTYNKILYKKIYFHFKRKYQFLTGISNIILTSFQHYFLINLLLEKHTKNIYNKISFNLLQPTNAKITTHKATKYLTSNSRQSNENLNYDTRRISWKRSLWSFSWTKKQSWPYTLSLCTCLHSLSTRMKKTKFNQQRVRGKLSKKIPKRQVWYCTKKLLNYF